MAANKCDKEGMRKVEEAVSYARGCIVELLSLGHANLPSQTAATLPTWFSPNCVFSLRRQDGQQYAKENNIIHLATSAKSGHNVKELFLEIGLSYVRCTVFTIRVAYTTFLCTL